MKFVKKKIIYESVGFYIDKQRPLIINIWKNEKEDQKRKH